MKKRIILLYVLLVILSGCENSAPKTSSQSYSFRYVRQFKIVADGKDVRQFKEDENYLSDDWQSAFKNAFLSVDSNGTVTISNVKDQNDITGKIVSGVIQQATKAGEEDVTGEWIEWEIDDQWLVFFANRKESSIYYSFIDETSSNIAVVFDVGYKSSNGKDQVFETQIIFNK